MSTMKFFREEYEQHVKEKRCVSMNCEALRKFVIDPQKCKGCSKCARNCPAGAIKGQIRKAYEIDFDTCIKCGACLSDCAFDAIHIEW